jgi:uncharacterized delta-60 repeat protein
LVGSVKPTLITNDNVMEMVRYNPDGSLDASFGNNGRVTTPGFGNYEGQWSVALQDTSRIVVAGTSNPTIPSDFALARYLTSGELDIAFGNNGVVVTDMYTESDKVLAVALHSDSKILVAGQSGIHFSVARYLSHIVSGLPSPTIGLASTVHPNPAHESVTLGFELPQPETVSVRLLDLRGRCIQVLQENMVGQVGENTLHLPLPKPLAPDIYLLALESESGVAIVKVVKL